MKTKKKTNKIYVVVYVTFSAFTAGIYTEQKVSYSKIVAQKYFNDFIADVADYVGNQDIETENINKSVFDYDAEGADGHIFHIEISEVELPI